MQACMAASSASVDSHHAADICVDSHHAADISSDNTTVALMSYNVGIQNKEVRSNGWAKSAGTRLKLKSDIEKIFRNQHGIQTALLCEIGRMWDKLSSGGSHPTAQEIFEGIIAELGLTHIQVNADEPYVALIDTRCWSVRYCLLIGDLCDKKEVVVQHLILEHVETGAPFRCFNGHMPTSLTTPKRRENSVLRLCKLATKDLRSGVPQPTASMPWLLILSNPM